MTTLDTIRDRVRTRLGIHLGPHKDYLVASRLERLLTHGKYPSPEAFVVALDSGDALAWEALTQHITTNHTYFFREAEHFSLLVELLRREGVARPRVWSAAGSTGEEGYSLAMTLAEAGYADHLVLVSDVNRAVVRRAHEGIYEGSRVSKVPGPLLLRYFEALAGDRYRVRDSLKAHVRFRCINLMDPLEWAEPLDVIFCRNLLIYFDAATAQDVLRRLVGVLRPGGWLFLGQTEGFHLPPGPVKALGSSIYQKLA